MAAADNAFLKIEKTARLSGLCIAILLTSCSERIDDQLVYDTSKSFVFRDVEYGTTSRQKMNVFLPAGRNNNTRLIILIHGGGWTAGTDSICLNYQGLPVRQPCL